jgi:Toastrack DUF4097
VTAVPYEGAGATAPVAVSLHRGRPAWRILASVVTVAALLWGALNVVNLLAHGEQHFRRTFSADGISRIDVSIDRGSVRVVARDRDDIELRAYVSDGLGDTDHDERVRGNRLLIDGDCTFPIAYWCTASYTLLVPRDVKLVVWSGSGDVTVTGTTADVDLTTEHGDVDASRLRGATARASTDDGSIRLGFAAPPMQVEASSADGDVTVVVPRAGVAYALDLSSDDGATSGEVRTDPTVRRSVRLSSEDGDVTVRYPAR